MKENDIVEWTNNDFHPRSVRSIITGKNTYSTFKEYLEAEQVSKCLHGFTNVEDGLKVYFKYYTKEMEKQHGVVAIHLQVLE